MPTETVRISPNLRLVNTTWENIPHWDDVCFEFDYMDSHYNRYTENTDIDREIAEQIITLLRKAYPEQKE